MEDAEFQPVRVCPRFLAQQNQHHPSIHAVSRVLERLGIFHFGGGCVTVSCRLVSSQEHCRQRGRSLPRLNSARVTITWDSSIEGWTFTDPQVAAHARVDNVLVYLHAPGHVKASPPLLPRHENPRAALVRACVSFDERSFKPSNSRLQASGASVRAVSSWSTILQFTRGRGRGRKTHHAERITSCSRFR